VTDRAIAIEPMTIDDLESVLTIERSSFQTPWSDAAFRHEIEANPLAWNVVARAGRLVVGFVCAYVIADELMINDLAVAGSHRRKGVGRALLAEVITGARTRGCRRATLEVRPSNAGARALYDAFGFVTVGRRRGYYADSGEDALLLARDL
jgi:ribosomal-protein-alanine N-acetyltransferase